MEMQDVFDYVKQTANAEPEALSPVSGGLTLSGKFKATVHGGDWMVKILPANANRQLWYQELNRRTTDRMANPKMSKLFEDGTMVLLSPWILGPNLEQTLVTATEAEVKEYGRQAAELLYLLHKDTIDFPAATQSVINRMLNACRQVESLGLTFPGHEQCCAFLRKAAQEHSFGRVSFLHKDIRPENFIVCDGILHLIDFDNGGLGEEAEDFAYLMTMGRPEHRPFSYALMQNYFQHTDPQTFWENNLIYSTLQVMEYAIWKWQAKGRQVFFQAENLMKQYEAFHQNTPAWWKELEGI